MKGSRRSFVALFPALMAAVPSVRAFVVAARRSPLLSPTVPVEASSSSALFAGTASGTDLDAVAENLNQALAACRADLARTCHVRVAPVQGALRLGLVASRDLAAGDTVLQVPFDDRYVLTADRARREVSGLAAGAPSSSPKGGAADGFEGWTGDAGLVALLLLQELARAAGTYEGADAAAIAAKLVRRDAAAQAFMGAWVRALPTAAELAATHPLLWGEDDQEVLQASSTNKIYRRLDDLEEDVGWLSENLFRVDPAAFPATVTLDGATIPCFSADGFRWALATTLSRSVFVDGALRLVPLLDFCNHDADRGREVDLGLMGTFRTTRGADLVTPAACRAGEQVFCSYGPKSAAEYLLEHGFVPEEALRMAVAEVAFELDPDDRFYDDKLDILEFETYDQAPMDPEQKFDLVSGPGRDGDPDPAMIQFVRLCKLGGTDAFLLESIFRKDVWGFMALPVSEKNELDVIDAITGLCRTALDTFEKCPEGGPAICTKIRERESKALESTIEYLLREKEALDLKEYYQQRRLKELNLDSPWSPEDDNEDLTFGQTRAPGGADYDF